MKLLLLLPSVRAGGAERVMATLAAGLAERGHDVTLATLNRGADFYPIDPRVRRIALDLPAAGRAPLAPLRSFFARYRALRALLRAERPDAAVSFLNRLNIRALLAARGLGIPIVVSERIAPERTGAGPLWRALRRLAYPSAALLVAQTEREAAWFRRFVRRIAVIPNPVPDACFSVSRPPRVPGSAPLLAAMGRLERQKGFDILIRSFTTVRKNFPECRLTIYGEGSQRRRLERLALRSGLSESVSLPGTTADPYGALANADVFVLPSRYEGFPNVLAEAMAVGIPVAAFDCPNGPRELIEPDITGKLLRKRSPQALAEALIDMLGNERRRRSRAEAAKSSIRDRCCRDRVLDAWEQAIAAGLSIGEGRPK
jgi:glycosyltransferase involved in cell wall biosynthesis